MANRRQFIQSGLALSAVSSTVISAFPAGVGATEVAALRLERFVFDSRFAEAVEIAQHVALQGVHLAEISGDLTDLWYDHLDLRWKKAPMALAGITTKQGLFVLETLAADYRMRVVYRGEHSVPRAGRVAHSLAGPADLIARVTPGLDAPVWGAALGQAMTQCPIGEPSVARLELTISADRGLVREETLFSWIIAPHSSVALMV